MKVNNQAYNFFFHPLAKEHSPQRKFWATITLVALSVLTLFSYTVAFAGVNISDNLQKKSVQPMPPKPKKANPAPQSLAVPRADLARVRTVKEKQRWQLEKFKEWAKGGKWHMFHHQVSHYDWWMFPLSRSSAGQGTTYTVYAPEIEALKQDAEFMQNFRLGAELVAKSWGWDIKTGKPVVPCASSQHWEDWPVRLGKMADSLKLFGEEDYRKNMQAFAMQCTKWHTLEPWVRKALQ